MGIGNRSLPAGYGSTTPVGQAVPRATIGAPAPVVMPQPPVIDPGGRLLAAKLAADRVRKRAVGSGRSGSIMTPLVAPAKPKGAATATPLPVLDLNPRPGAWRTY
jgi:hypothetical protein